jgi:hypothetical protein
MGCSDIGEKDSLSCETSFTSRKKPAVEFPCSLKVPCRTEAYMSLHCFRELLSILSLLTEIIDNKKAKAVPLHATKALGGEV